MTEYTWDHRNRLTAVTHYADYTAYQTASPDQIVEYAYDFGNRWVRRVLDANGDGTPEGSTVFVQDGNQIALQFDKTGTGDAAAGDLSHRYLWGPAVDQILADEQVDSLLTPGDVLWPLTDHLGSVRDLATYDAPTDTTTIANHRTYDAFGNVTSETTPAVDHLFAFTGRALDEDTTLQNNVNRWYDAAVGRWLSEDPIGFEGADANLYRYVLNTPMGTIDPFGLAGFRERFMAATPAMPKDWHVHHFAQKHPPIARRMASELGVNVQDLSNLRGVHPKVHSEINVFQQKFWRQQAKKYGSLRAAYEKTPMKDILKMQVATEEFWGSLWVKAGANEHKICGIQDRIKSAGKRFSAIGRARRTNGALRRIGIGMTVLSVFSVAWENTTLAANILAPPPHVQRAYENFLEQYSLTYSEALRDGRIDKNRWYHLDRSLQEYMSAAGFDERVRNVIQKTMLERYLSL